MIHKLGQRWKNFTTVPVYIGGMVPAESNNPDSGTAVALYTKRGSMGDTLALGRSDENGEFNGRISRKYIGKTLIFPVRHHGYVYDHEYLYVVQPWGVFNAVKMKEDREYNGKLTNIEKDFAKISVEEYLKADRESQYRARLEVTQTWWFFVALLLAGITILIQTIISQTNLPAIYVTSIGWLVSLFALAIRSNLTKHILGLTKEPLGKTN